MRSVFIGFLMALGVIFLAFILIVIAAAVFGTVNIGTHGYLIQWGYDNGQHGLLLTGVWG